MSVRSVLPPEFGFSELRQSLLNDGWIEVRIPGLLPPLQAGEPEQARFEKGRAHLIYSYNPVVQFRAIEGDAEISLPKVSGHQIENWLTSDSNRGRARGCLAAAELGLTHLAPLVAKAASTLDPALRTLAKAAQQRLTPLPEASPLAAFEAQPAALKPQMLRNIAHNHPAVAAKLLGKCWADGPELALSATVFATRFNVTSLIPEIDKFSVSGLARDQRTQEIFVALKKACLATLHGAHPNGNQTAKDKFWRLLLGERTELSDAGAVITALTTPSPDLQNHDDEWCSVLPVPHILGHQSGKGYSNPIRLWTPAAFHIGRECLRDPSGRAYLVTDDPKSVCRNADNQQRLPTPSEWEAGLRGPNGRLYAWGVTQKKPVVAISDWGVLWSGYPEWVQDEDGTLAICGRDPSGRITFIAPPRQSERAAVRLVKN